jgi:hypothetical protein
MTSIAIFFTKTHVIDGDQSSKNKALAMEVAECIRQSIRQKIKLIQSEEVEAALLNEDFPHNEDFPDNDNIVWDTATITQHTIEPEDDRGNNFKYKISVMYTSKVYDCISIVAQNVFVCKDFDSNKIVFIHSANAYLGR